MRGEACACARAHVLSKAHAPSLSVRVCTRARHGMSQSFHGGVPWKTVASRITKRFI